MTAIQNLVTVGSLAFASFFIALFFNLMLKRSENNISLRFLKRKYILVPALVFLLTVIVAPRERIGPPPDQMTNAIVTEFRNSLSDSFEVLDLEPYLPRVRIEFSYYMTFPEICECTLFVYQNATLIRNVTVSIYESLSDSSSSNGHSTFSLAPGDYQIQINQQLLSQDGMPKIGARQIQVHFEQLQDLSWIEEDFIWEQYLLLLFTVGFGLLMCGIWITDHNFDAPDEYERYIRKRKGYRNYPYSRSYRRAQKRNNH